MKPATEILLSAAFALTPEEHWTTGQFARKTDGNVANHLSPKACRWCVDGALMAAREELGYPFGIYSTAWNTLSDAIRASGSYCDVIHFNDLHTHAEVLEALYHAADLSEAS